MRRDEKAMPYEWQTALRPEAPMLAAEHVAPYANAKRLVWNAADADRECDPNG